MKHGTHWKAAAALILSIGSPGFSFAGGQMGLRQRAEPERSAERVEHSWESEHLRRVIMPLVRSMDRPCRPEELRIGLLRKSEVNAGNAGGCEFLVTSGLLERATDDQLRGVFAHELAHQDLGHVAKAQTLGAGLNIGVALLERWLPGSSALTPIAGALIARGYGRNEEYAADRHAVEILNRAGYRKELLVDTLTWIRRNSEQDSGGLLSTHPALDERITALRRVR